MYKGNSTRMFPIVLVLIVIVIVVMTLVTIGKAIFGGGSSNETPSISTSSLLSTSANSNVRMLIRGPIVANEDFHTTEVIVSPTGRNANVFSGYSNSSAGSEIYDNTTKAYEEFVYALERADFMSGTQLKDAKDDTRGICATGHLYEFETRTGDIVTKHLWTSTCKNNKGSLKVGLSQIKGLFLKQIPHDSKIINKIDL